MERLSVCYCTFAQTHVSGDGVVPVLVGPTAEQQPQSLPEFLVFELVHDGVNDGVKVEEDNEDAPGVRVGLRTAEGERARLARLQAEKNQ